MIAIDGRGVPQAVFGSITAAGARFTSWDAAIRRPVSAVHRIGFIQLAAGVGATTLAAEVVRIVSARRSAPPLAVDLSRDGGLAVRLGIDESATRTDRHHVRTSVEAAATLNRTTVGAWGVRPADAATEPVRAWAYQIAPIMRFHEVIVADFGPRDPNGDLSAVAALCEAICVVAPAQRGAAEQARIIADAIGLMPEHPRPVIALIDAERTSRRVPQVIAAQGTHPVIRIPHDAGLVGGGAARGLPARQAVLRLASLLVGENDTSGEAAA